MAKHTPLKGLNQEYPDGRPGFHAGNPSGHTETSSLPLVPAPEARSPSEQGAKRLAGGRDAVKQLDSFTTTEASGGLSYLPDGAKNAGAKNNLLKR